MCVLRPPARNLVQPARYPGPHPPCSTTPVLSVRAFVTSLLHLFHVTVPGPLFSLSIRIRLNASGRVDTTFLVY